MKTAKIITLITLILAVGFLPISIFTYAKENQTPKDFLRLHIRANSNSDEDQELKLKVRNEVLVLTSELFKNIKTKDEAVKVSMSSMSKIIRKAEQVVLDEGYDYSVKAELKNEYFEYREYEGFFLPEGYYDSLIIKLGKGEGNNWWCVLFPCVCVSGSSTSVETKIENVPSRFRLSNKVAEGEVKFDFWIFKTIRQLFE